MNVPPIIPGSTRTTRVLCVDDNPDIMAVMQMLIDTEPLMKCIGCLVSADCLIEGVRQLNPPPDVVVLDATMPGKNPLIEMTKLSAEFPAIKTIIYSGHNDPTFIDRAMNAGAWGCVSKSDQPGAILRAIREVANGNPWWPQSPHRR